MRAEYDSAANATSIVIADTPVADASDAVHSRGIVAPADGKAIEVQILYPDMGITSLCRRHPLDMALISRRSPLRPSRLLPPRIGS